MDKIRIKGEFLMNAFKIVNGEKRLFETYKDDNLIVDSGRYALCRLLANNGYTNYYVNKIAFGEGTVAPVAGDTDLTVGYFRKNIIDYLHTGSNIITFNWELLATEGNGLAIAEYGLYTNGDYLFARKIRSVINKADDIILEGSWKITFVLCP